tara:strand:- start:5076 stop:5537 length:462 start_codon:yes stop_codon:yes gene_type:complete
MVFEEGNNAENFELTAHDGSTISLQSYKDKKNVVLCFYPKNHLFGCPSKKVFEMAESVISVFSQIESTDAVLFAISVDTVESQAKFVDDYKIPYIHLSDTKKSVCKKYAGLNMVGLAKRSTFVINKKGIVSNVFRDIDAKNHGNQILEALKQI